MDNKINLSYSYINGESDVVKYKHKQINRRFFFCVIVHVLEGEYFVAINNQVMKLTANDTIVIPEEVLHNVWMENQGKISYAHFTCRFISQDVFGLISQQCIMFNNTQINDIIFMLNSTTNNVIEQKLNIDIAIANLVRCTLKYANYDYGSLFYEVWLYNVLSYIHNNIDKMITVDDLIRTSSLSHTTFYKKFKSVANASPNEYIIREKIKFSCRLLLNGKNVNETAKKSGFSDETYFSKLFKKCIGISPSKYREYIKSKML